MTSVKQNKKKKKNRIPHFAWSFTMWQSAVKINGSYFSLSTGNLGKKKTGAKEVKATIRYFV